VRVNDAQALTRYATRFITFLLPLALLFGALELGTRRVGTLHRARAVALEQGGSGEVVVTGNSHETVGIICKELGRSCVKLAAGSQSLFYDRDLLLRYGPRLEGVKVALLGVSYYSFKYAMESDEGWREYEYLHAYGFDGERRPLPWSDVRRYSAVMTYGPKSALAWASQGFPRLLPAAAADAQGDVDVSAFVQREKSPEALARRLTQHQRRLRPELLNETRAALTQMLQWATSHGVVPVLVVSPVTRGYATGCDAREVAEMRAELARLAAAHGAQVRDYFDDARFAEAEFYDFDHLNRRGAEHFTRLLREEVLDPLSRPVDGVK
jgi:hypothetical protein